MVIKTLCRKKKTKKETRYWVALDQQKTVSSEIEFGSEIKLQDACSHFDQQLEKMEWRISKIEQFKR